MAVDWEKTMNVAQAFGGWATVVGTVGGLAALWFIFRQLREMNDQSKLLQQSVAHAADAAASARRDAQIAEEGLQVQQTTMKAQLRAYLNVRLPSKVQIVDNAIEFSPRAQNSGQTPALKVRHRVSLFVADPGSTEYPEGNWGSPDEGDEFHAMGPGVDVYFPITIQNELLDHHALLFLEYRAWIYGIVDYEDVFGDKHSTKYCYFLDAAPLEGASTKEVAFLRLAPRGNTMT